MPKPLTFESKKRFKKPNAWQREFHNVKKLAHYTRVKVASKRREVTICTMEVKEFHMNDGTIEEQPPTGLSTCAVIPKDVLPQLFKALKEA